MSARDGGARLFVPGRIEVLGKHTDYAGGRSLLAAVDRGFTVAVEPADDPRVTIHDTGRHETVALTIPDDLEGSDGPGWAVYPRTVARRAFRDFPGALRGCRIEIEGTLPPAAGLSTSSALITAVFLALDAVCGLSRTEPYRSAVGGPPLGPGTGGTGDGAIAAREALAGYLGTVERGSPYPGLGGVDGGPRGGPEGVGTRGGSEDHVAILCAQPGALVRYAFEPVRREGAVPMPPGYVFAVGASGVVAEKKGAARERYNALSDGAAAAARAWAAGVGNGEEDGVAGGGAPTLGRALDAHSGEEVLEAIRRGAERLEPAVDPDALVRRARQFVDEVHLVDAAFDALAVGDLAGFAAAANRSADRGAELLGNQIPETLALTDLARGLGAPAASPFGAGFGGSVWALVPESDADGFLTAWRAAYLDAFPARSDAAFFTTPASPAVQRLD